MSRRDPRHVLVADDDEASRYLVESLLRGAGYEVRAVSDGEEALAEARSWPVDLLVTDVLMPRMDGYRLVQAWKSDPLLAGVPVMFYTATYTDRADERLASDLGVDRFLTKPQDPEVLLASVADLLGREHVNAGAARSDEAEVLREYSERLVSKLEDKVVELDTANAELRHAVEVLSEEIGVKNALIDRLNRDVADREQTQRVLRDTNDALDAIIASSPLAIVGLDAGSRVTIWNPAAEQLFGWTADEVLGEPNPVVPDEAMEEHRRVFGGTAKGRGVVGYETRRRTKDGRTIDVELSTARLSASTTSGGDAIAVYQDITERRKTEQMKSDFISAVSHELRTPLTAILGFSDLLATAAGADHPECRRMAERIRGKAGELGALLDRLLEAASIQAGSTSISPMMTDVELFLGVGMKAMKVPDGYTLELDVEPGIPAIPVDRARLGSVIDELVHNAFKYSPGGGPVRVTARLAGELVLISVSDEGVGISREDIPAIFERFTQADMSSTREFPGMGLGLYMARQVVEAHGGSLEARSEEGAGSTFTISLPLA
ncbi:MAG TPA: ATP-binding protein [Coriobacteriia bacterium]|jgi:PAS domain S-box-containing protein